MQCRGCGAVLGHLAGCGYENYTSSYTIYTRPKLTRREIIDKILEEFFNENKGIKEDGKKI